MPHFLVIGAGISGLTAAYRLRQLLPDAKITVLEKSQRIGGNIVTDLVNFAGGEFLVEGAADSFLSRKARGIALCKELGLLEHLQGRDPRYERTFVKFGGKLHPLPAGLTGMIPTNLQAMNSSTLLSEAGRARLAQEVDLPPYPGDADESLASFVSRRLGQEAYERMVEPLMSGIYAGDGTKLSLAATFPQLRQLEKKYGSLIKGLTATNNSPNAITQPAPYPAFVALRGGTGELLTTLADRFGPCSIHTGIQVKSIRRDKRGFQAELSDASIIQADGVILATPAYSIAALLHQLDPTISLLHSEIEYSSAATVTFGYRESQLQEKFTGYGYVIPQVEDRDMLACSWMSNKWQGRAPADFHLVRLYIGRLGNPIAEEADDQALITLSIHELQRTLGIEAQPEFSRIYRWHRSMPQYMMGHVERIAQIEARMEALDGIALAGAAYHGVGIPDCIASGEQAAERIANYHGR